MHGLSDLVPAWGRRYASGLVKFKAAVVPLEINKQQQFSYLGFKIAHQSQQEFAESMNDLGQKAGQSSEESRPFASDPTSLLSVQLYNKFESCISSSTLHLFALKDKVLRRSVEITTECSAQRGRMIFVGPIGKPSQRVMYLCCSRRVRSVVARE